MCVDWRSGRCEDRSGRKLSKERPVDGSEVGWVDCHCLCWLFVFCDYTIIVLGPVDCRVCAAAGTWRGIGSVICEKVDK